MRLLAQFLFLALAQLTILAAAERWVVQVRWPASHPRGLTADARSSKPEQKIPVYLIDKDDSRNNRQGLLTGSYAGQSGKVDFVSHISDVALVRLMKTDGDYLLAEVQWDVDTRRPRMLGKAALPGGHKLPRDIPVKSPSRKRI